MEEVLEALERRFKHSKGTIQNVIILVVIYGFEEFIRTQLFRCPCTNFSMYSLVMMTGPALFLVGLSFSMSGGFWQAVLNTSKLQHYKDRCNYRMKSLSRIFQPFFAPMAYVTFALLKGDFFVCSRTGSSQGCGKTNPDKPVYLQTERDHLRMHMQSQILGFGLLVAVTLFSLGLVCIRRCCFEDDTLPSMDEYDDIEKEILGRLLRGKLQAAVEEDVKKRINDVFQVRSHKDLKDAFYRARELLPAVCPEKRNGRYKRLNLDEDEAEVQIMDSTQL